MTDRYAKYQPIQFDQPAAGVLRIRMANGKMNSADTVMHAELGEIWRDVDADLDDKAVEIAARLAGGAQSAIRWTKYSLNNWLRQAGPSFDASLALEFLGFTGPEAKEGLASFREKRKPSFPPMSPV